MNARLIGVVAITILASAGCKSKTPASNSSSTVVQAAAPSGNAQPTAEASRASLTPPKAKLLDNDDEYIDLKEGRGKAVEGCISTYEQTVAALKQTRDARVMAKVGNISDAGLRKQMTDAAESSEPQIDTSSAENVEENCKQNRLPAARKDYLAHHTRDFFLVATYEDYYPTAGKLLFSVKKTPNPPYDRGKYGLGTPYPHCLAHETEIGDSDNNDPAPYQRYLQCQDSAQEQVKGFGRPVEDRSVISDDRFKPDFLKLDNSYGCERGSDCEMAFLIEATPQDADRIYSTFSDLWAPLVNGIISDELRAGQATHFFPPREFDGRIVDGTIRCEYTTSTCADAMKKETLGFARRQGIMLVGRGDPFEMKMAEACVIVAGRDECLLEVK